MNVHPAARATGRPGQTAKCSTLGLLQDVAHDQSPPTDEMVAASLPAFGEEVN